MDERTIFNPPPRTIATNQHLQESSSFSIPSTTISPPSDSAETLNTAFSAPYDRLAVGPTVQIHRYDVGVKLLQLLIFCWLVAGLSFLLCVALCAFVGIGYVTFRSEGYTFIVVCAFIFYCFFLFKVLKSLIRTFIRISISVWKEKFGAGSRDLVLLRWIDSLSRWMFRNSFEDPHVLEMRTEYSKTFVLFLILLSCIAIPLVSVASFFGYWALISVLCSFLTLGSAVTIVLVNLVSRFVRALRFFFTAWKISGYREHSVTRIRAAYIASTGHDHGRNILDVFIEKTIVSLLVLMISSFVFSGFHFKLVVLISCACLIGILAFLRLRNYLKCYQKTLEETYAPQSSTQLEESISNSSDFLIRNLGNLESASYYDGKTKIRVYIVFTVRFILFLLGLASLVYLDLKEVGTTSAKRPVKWRLSESSAHELIYGTAAYFVITMLKDIIFFTSYIFAPLRPFLLFFFQALQIFVGIAGCIYVTGFTSAAAVLISIYEMNYREAKRYWSSEALREIKPTMQRERAMRNTFMIIGMFAITIFVALVVGITVGGMDSPQPPSDISGIFADAQNISSSSMVDIYGSPICASRFSPEQLNIVDLATMSAASYQVNTTDVLKILHQNPNLEDWTLGLYSLDNSNRRPIGAYNPNKTVQNINITTGIRFAEFVSPNNVSVIAIRGTYKLEDLFQDLYLWSTVALLQTSSYFGTLVNLWPSNTVAFIVYIITQFASYPNLVYWDEMEGIVKKIIEYKGIGIHNNAKDDSNTSGGMVMLTGHSLGGGLANIVGNHLMINSVTFSSPGLGYSVLNYNLSTEILMTHSLNVVPVSDPVAAFDKQLGLVQNIMCDAGYPLECHSLERTLNTLAQMCRSLVTLNNKKR